MKKTTFPKILVFSILLLTLVSTLFISVYAIEESKATTIAEQVVLSVGADETERNLAWFSSIAEAGEVRIAPASAVVDGVFPSEYQSFIASSAPAVNATGKYAKAATLNGLTENTEYAYVIALHDGTLGKIYFFHTGSFDDFEFVFVGDPQISKKEHGTAWKNTVEKIKEHFDPELLISAGDQVTTATNETLYSYLIPDELSNVTFVPTVGPGHDSPSATFSDHFSLPNLSTKYGVGETSSNYWYVYNNTLFMHLNMENDDALFNGEHEAFIVETMAANPHVKWNVLIAHRAPFSTGLHGNPDYKNYKTEIAKIRPALSSMATRVGIDVVLSGHDHVYVRTLMMVNDEVGFDTVINNKVVNPEGILYITASSSTASKFYTQSVQDAYFVAAENYEHRKSAIRFEVTDTTLTMTSYFLDDMSVFDTFTIEKKDINFIPDDNLTTPYGVIPETYADKSAYPAVVFDKAGNLLGAYPALNFDLMDNHFDKPGDVIVYLRANTTTGAKINFNTGMGSGSKLIDLAGHTLTLENTLIYAQAKSSDRIRITIKDGMIDCGDYYVWKIGAKAEGTDKIMKGVFENVTFCHINAGLVSDSIGANAIASSDLIFNDCVFENPTATLFAIGNDELCTLTISLNGGMLINDQTTIPVIFVFGNYKNNTTVSFGKGNQDRRLTVTTAKTELDTDGIIFDTTEGKLSFIQDKTVQTQTQSTFVLAEYTMYGLIPEDYFDYAIIVFDSDKNICLATNKLSANGDETTAFGYVSAHAKGTLGKNYVIYLRRNVTKAKADDDYGLGAIGGDHILDLGGHTLTQQTRTLFVMTALNDLPFSYTVKNGSIQLPIELIKFQAKTEGTNKETSFIFENVTFKNTSSNPRPLVRGTSGEQKNVDYTVHIEFIDCIFNIPENSYLFNLDGNSNSSTDVFDKANINITVRGGVMDFSDRAFLLCHPTSLANRTLTISTSDGKYPIVKLTAETDVSTYTTSNEIGKALGLYKIDTEGEKNVYIFTPFAITNAHLNLTNDINMVYGVYIPEGYSNPMATFRIGELETTVTEYTYNKEKGLYYFTFAKIGPHKMNDIVTATITATFGETTQTVIHGTLSIRRYIDMVGEQHPEDAKLLALLNAILVYGAHAQIYMGYETDILVAEAEDLTVLIPEAMVKKEGVANKDYVIAGYGLRLDGAFRLGVQIKADDISSLTLKVTKDGIDTVVAITEEMKNSDYYVVYYDALSASEFDKNITFTLMKNGESIGKSLTLCANAYLAQMQNYEKESNLVKALYLYGLAAKVFVD